MPQSDSRQLPGPNRLEAFSDGVLAIVITLLVLELKVPHIESTTSATEAFHALLALAPKFLGYVLSFLFVAVFWVNHHRFFQLVGRVDVGLLWLNTLLLLTLSFIPFPTAFIGEYPGNATALALFAVVLMTAGIAFHLMWRRARSKSLFHEHVDDSAVRRAITRGMVGPAMYAVAAILAFLLPAGSWMLFLAIPLYYAFAGMRRGTPGHTGATPDS